MARPVFDRMMADARAGRVQPSWFGRSTGSNWSMVGAFQTVPECDRIGVRVISVREPWLEERTRSPSARGDLRVGRGTGTGALDRANERWTRSIAPPREAARAQCSPDTRRTQG